MVAYHKHFKSFYFVNVVNFVGMFIISFLLFLSSIPHIANPFAFASTIESYRIIYGKTAFFLASSLPIIEATIAIALLFFPRYRKQALLYSLLLFCLFLIVQASALVRGIDISCGCFGSASMQIGVKTIAIATFGFLYSFFGFATIKKTVSVT